MTTSSLGDPVQPASGMLVLNASKLKDFATCPRRYFLGSVLKLARADTDEGGRAQLGSAVHAELFARHEDMHTHDSSEPVDGSLGLTPTALSMVRRHRELCPANPSRSGPNDESAGRPVYLGVNAICIGSSSAEPYSLPDAWMHCGVTRMAPLRCATTKLVHALNR